MAVDHVDSAKYLLSENDLVIARTGASVVKTYLFNPAEGIVVFAGFLIRVKPDIAKMNVSFLAQYTSTSEYWSWVQTTSMRSGQPGINGNEIAAMELNFPKCTREQTAIAQTLTDIDTQITALKSKLTKAHQIKQGMMQELLTGRIRLMKPVA